MNSFEDMIEAGIRCHDKIMKTSAPLFDLFNLKNFGYFEVNNLGHYYYFGTNVPWCEYFISEKLYLNYPYFRHPKLLQEGINLPWFVKDSSFKKVLNSARDQFDMHHSLLLFNKSAEKIEAFGFCSAFSMEEEKTILLQELPLLRLFIKKFKEEHSSLFSYMEDFKVDLLEQIGPLFYENTPCHSSRLAAKQDFLKKMGIELCDPLSLREKEIISFLLKDLSANQVAKRIFLSRRTIEHHVERIKEKLQCESKSELIQKTRELEELGCL